MKAAFITSEVYPYSKTGGLADVSKALPEALRKYIDIITITPLYKHINKKNLKKLSIDFDIFGSNFSVFKSGYIYFLNSNIFDRMYGYNDDEIRFIKFSFVAIKLLTQLGDFDIIHINDWQSSLLAFLLKRENIKSQIVLTIHNLAYQGIAAKTAVEQFGLGWENFTFDKMEYYDKINLLKSGIVYCDKFNTVSKAYAKEIQTPTFSEGLGSVIYENAYKLEGILNGIDYAEFNPKTDINIPQNYNSKTIEDKIINKKELFKKLNISDIQKPLFSFIGRFTKQKGVDLIVNNQEFLSNLPINIIMLGSGELNRYVQQLKIYDNFRVITEYNEPLSRIIYASSDFFLMPSLFEPCGLSQLIAAAYGDIPIVSYTGGLIDTVSPTDKNKIFGFTFFSNSNAMFRQSITDAIELYKDKNTYLKKASSNMNINFSWDRSAKEYIKFYNTQFVKTDRQTIKKADSTAYIPASYNDSNRVEFMNINPFLSFVYWDIKTSLKNSYNDIYIAVFDEEYLIFKYRIDSLYGEYFINYNTDMKKLSVYIGIFEQDAFIDIINKKRIVYKTAQSAKIVKSEQNTDYFTRSGGL